MGIKLYPQSTSLVSWRRCRPLQFQLEPCGVKFVVSLVTALVCVLRGPEGRHSNLRRKFSRENGLANG